MNDEDAKIVKRIKDIRAKNNTHWMRILEIALEFAPVRTKSVLQAISDNDRAIVDLTEELAK